MYTTWSVWANENKVEQVSVLLVAARTGQAGILRPGYYEAPGFGRDDAPLRWNILSFYFRPLGEGTAELGR